MLITAFAYFLFLYIDIRLHVSKAKQALKKRDARQELIEDYMNRVNVRDLFSLLPESS